MNIVHADKTEQPPLEKKIGISCGYFSAGFLQDTFIPNALQQSSYNPAPDTSCDPLHFLYNRTCHVHMHTSLPIPDVILVRSCSPPHHMILVISCTSVLVMCTCTCPYPPPDVILARPCSLPCHMILVISCTSGLVMCTCTCPYPSPDVILARPCSLPCRMILVISCTSRLVVYTCTCPYPLLM